MKEKKKMQDYILSNQLVNPKYNIYICILTIVIKLKKPSKKTLNSFKMKNKLSNTKIRNENLHENDKNMKFFMVKLKVNW